jgi:outer membrane protein OmpA-like peptidoglycan-associated protein
MAEHKNDSKKDAGHGHGHGEEDGKHKKKKHGHGGGHGGGGHGGEEHEGAPEWLISFADMVMLMMGFFVILFAMNAQPKGGNAGGGGEQSEGVANQPDMIDFAIAVRRAFHNEVDLSSTDPKDQLLIQRIMSERAQGSGDSKDEGTKGKDRNVQSVRPSEHFGRGTSVAFTAHSAVLPGAAAAALDEFARTLRGQSTVVEVRGHVGASENYGAPDQAMQLSTDRALSAAKRLAAAGVDWWRIRVVAAGSGERVEPFPTDSAADARNSRVEVRVLDEVAAPREPSKPFATATPGADRAD